MPYRCLSEFLAALEDDGDLLRIEEPVDPAGELAELTRQVAASEGPALLLTDVVGSRSPVVSNLLGAENRLCKALGVASFDEAAAHLVADLVPGVPEGRRAALGRLPELSRLTQCPPNSTTVGACQQVVRMGSDVRLSELPIPHCWPGETGRTITAGAIHTQCLDTGQRDVSGCPMLVTGDDALALGWSLHDDACELARRYREAGRQMPVAIVLGGDPLLSYVSGAAVPAGVDKLLCAGLLRKSGVELVRGRTVELEVPAEADIVLEGYIDADSPPLPRAAFASPLGLMTELTDLPVLRITALTHRANPVFPVVVPSAPPSEVHVQWKLTERLALPFLKMLLPELQDVNRPLCGNGRELLFVSIKKRFPHQARGVVSTLCGQRAFLGVKMVVVVDADVDVRQEHQVWLAAAANMAPQRDVFVSTWPGAVDDPAAEVAGTGSVLAIDATRKLPSENRSRRWPTRAAAPDEVRRRVAEVCVQVGWRPGERAGGEWQHE